MSTLKTNNIQHVDAASPSISLDTGGNVTVTGIITATSFSGSGANLTGIAATANVVTNSLVVSGVSTFAAGSASAPSISPTGDSNTGIFFPSADTIAFGEGGAEAARFNSAGYLGIGTNNPAARLHSIGGTTSGSVDTAAIFTGGVINTIGSGARIVLSGVPGFETIRGTYIEGVFDTATNAHSLRFGTNASTAAPVERLRIDNGGRLITGNSGFTTTSAYGSTTQYSNLHIIGGAGTNNGGGIFIARNTPSTNADNQDLGGIYWGTNDGKTYARIASWVDGTSTASSNPGYISFQTTADGGTSPTERLRIDSQGRVSIGAVTSSAKLQINHQATDQYGIYVPGGIYTGTGFAGFNYGGYFRSNTSNSGTTRAIGVYGTIADGPAGTGYGGYFDGASDASNQRIGVYGTARQSDLNGPAQQVGGWFNVNTSASGTGTLGSTIAVRAENASTLGSSSIGVRVTTVAGPTNIYGHVYEHAGSTMFRVKSNGGIDNYSGNNTNLSDIREKKNIEDIERTWDCLKGWNLKEFHFNTQDDSEDKHYGVIAQQIETVCPEVVSEFELTPAVAPKQDNDGTILEEGTPAVTRKSVKEQKMMWMAIKALQEAQTRIETLESTTAAQSATIAALDARLTALEGGN